MKRNEQESTFVFEFGKTSSGQIVWVPVSLKELEGKNVQYAAAGWRHSLAFSKHGHVFSWGWSRAAGHGTMQDVERPSVIRYLSLHKALSGARFICGAGGGDFSVALSEKGSVFTFGGEGEEGQLGSSASGGGGGGGGGICSLVSGLGRVKIVRVACGGAHACAIDEEGSLYTWGRGDRGQLGHGDSNNRRQPQRVKPSSKNWTAVRVVACGWSHSVVGCDGGVVWSCGKGSEGQLGLGEGALGDEKVFREVKALQQQQQVPVLAVAAGYCHTAVLMGGSVGSRRLWTWGGGEKGQLGHGVKASQSQPKVVEGLLGRQIEGLACGGFHTVAFDVEGSCWVWGEASCGQLGIGEVAEDEGETTTDAESSSLFINDQHQHQLQQQQQQHRVHKRHHVLVPTLVNALLPYRVVCVTAGFWHTVVVAERQLENASPRSPESSSSSSSGLLSKVSSQEVLTWSDDDDLRKLGAALKASEDSTMGSGLALAPGTCTVAGVLIAKPAPARDTMMKKNLGVNNANNSNNGNSLAPSGNKSAMVRVSSFLQQLFSLENSDEESGAAEVEFAVASEKSEAFWKRDILPEWEELKRKGKLSVIVSKGVPPGLRGDVWKLCIGNPLKITEDTWLALREKALCARTAVDAADEGAKVQKLIQVDLPRTFPKMHLFQDVGPLYNDLMEVLEAFAIFRPELGYVQGMSFIAGMLLMHMNQLDTFIGLVGMLNNHFFDSLFRFNIRECLKHIRIYELLFSKHLPRLFQHFQNLGVSPEHYLLDWWFSIFSRCLPFSVSVRVWDSYLLEGEVFLFRTAIALLAVFESQLLQSNLEQCVPLLRRLPEDTEETKLFKAIDAVTVPPYINQFLQRICAKSQPKQ